MNTIQINRKKDVMRAVRQAALLLCVCFAILISQVVAAPAPSGKAPEASKQPLPAPIRIKTIQDYKKELGLSSDQLKTIQDALKDFQERLIKSRAELQVSELNVRDLIGKKADLKDIQAQVEKSSAIQVQMRMADIETARKIEDTLTPEQLDKWHAIQREARSKSARAK